MPGDLENNYPTDIYIDVEKAVYQDLNPVKNGQPLCTHLLGVLDDINPWCDRVNIMQTTEIKC